MALGHIEAGVVTRPKKLPKIYTKIYTKIYPTILYIVVYIWIYLVLFWNFFGMVTSPKIIPKYIQIYTNIYKIYKIYTKYQAAARRRQPGPAPSRPGRNGHCYGIPQLLWHTQHTRVLRKYCFSKHLHGGNPEKHLWKMFMALSSQAFRIAVFQFLQETLATICF